MSEKTSISAQLRAVMDQPDPQQKAQLARLTCKNIIEAKPNFGTTSAPIRPARPAKPDLLPPNKLPRRTKGGLKGRQALLHSLAHIELNAIDLAADIIVRFGATMPDQFIADWLGVLDDEARHFMMLDAHLQHIDCFYGALPAHDGLWQAAIDTSHDLGARLVIVPLVHEARGLDVTPATVKRLEANGDAVSAALLQEIYEDEIAHVRVGMTWLTHYCERNNLEIEAFFHATIDEFMRGGLKPPFNDDARALADFPATLYARKL